MQATEVMHPGDFDEGQIDIAQYLSALKRRKYWLIVPAVVIMTISVLLAVLLPPTYRSSATLLIEAQDIPMELVRSTVNTFATQQIEVITRRVTTLGNVEKMAKKFGLYGYGTAEYDLSSFELVEEFRNKMDVDLISASVIDPRSGAQREAAIAFSLSFDDESAATAQKVVNELVTLYLEENTRARSAAVSGTLEFLQSEADELGRELSEKEAALATFKLENEGALPEQYAYNVGVIERIERELLDIDLSMQQLARQKADLLSKMAREGAGGAGDEQGMMNDAERLADLKQQYREASAKYQDRHPDIQWLKREIEVLEASLASPGTQRVFRDLQARRSKRDTLAGELGAQHPDVAALDVEIAGLEAELAASKRRDNKTQSSEVAQAQAERNPAYLLIADEIRSIDGAMGMLKTKRAERERSLSKHLDYTQRMPQLEQQYSAMVRDYRSAQAKYQDLKAKLRETEVAQSLEQDRKGERFTLIEPPIAAKDPVKPNRVAILFIGCVLSLGGGLGLVVLLEMLDGGIRGSKALAAIMGAPPLVVVPYLDTQTDLRRVLRRRIIAAVCLVLFVVAVAVSLHLFYKPLDVLWYVVLARFGAL